MMPGPKPLSPPAARSRATRQRRTQRRSSVSSACLEPPSRLSDAERRTWHELVDTFEPLRVLTSTDVPLLELIVRTWITWQDAERSLAETGMTFTTATGYVAVHPAAGISLKNRQLLRQLLNEIGATPSSRTSVDARPADAKPNAFQAYLARTKAPPTQS